MAPPTWTNHRRPMRHMSNAHPDRRNDIGDGRKKWARVPSRLPAAEILVEQDGACDDGPNGGKGGQPARPPTAFVWWWARLMPLLTHHVEQARLAHIRGPTARGLGAGSTNIVLIESDVRRACHTSRCTFSPRPSVADPSSHLAARGRPRGQCSVEVAWRPARTPQSPSRAIPVARLTGRHTEAPRVPRAGRAASASAWRTYAACPPLLRTWASAWASEMRPLARADATGPTPLTASTANRMASASRRSLVVAPVSEAIAQKESIQPLSGLSSRYPPVCSKIHRVEK